MVEQPRNQEQQGHTDSGTQADRDRRVRIEPEDRPPRQIDADDRDQIEGRDRPPANPNRDQSDPWLGGG